MEYLVDSNGFIENGEVKKPFVANPTSDMLIAGGYMYSGDEEGCIRSYKLN